MATMTRSDAKDLSRLVKSLRNDARLARMGGLTGRAAELEQQADTVAEKLQAAVRARREEDLEAVRAKVKAQERHDKMMAEREQDAKRQAAAAKWFRSALTRMGGQPQPADSLLQMAEAAGHDPDDIEAISVRVRRRGTRYGDTVCLALPGTFLRGRWMEIDG